jgi:aspartyl-tRNA(Asn)/glutamyl-tRNA(Gln) amidotransferase subunit C
MSIDRRTIEKMATLAKLNFNEADLPIYQKNLSDALTLIEHISQAEVSHLSPMAHPLHTMVQRLRADEVTEIDQHVAFQKTAPSVTAGLYLVPAVLESSE